MTARLLNPIGVNTYSYLWTTPALDCVTRLAALGYREFELLVSPPHLLLDEFTASERRRFAAQVARDGIAIRSLNVPSLDHNLASSMRRMREYSVRLFVDAIDLAADLNATYLVVVPGRMSPLFAPTQALRETWMRESLDPLVAHADKRGVKLVLENVPFAAFPDAATMGAFVRSYATPTLSVCYDAANAHFIGESPAHGLRALGDLVSLVHLSDTTRTHWKHDEIGLGDVPFAEIRAALDDIHYKGTCMLEIISPEPEGAIARSHRAIEGLGFAAPGQQGAQA
ncbi:sugar phosphate isomerase/epimerase family protein [Burkholderia sp. Ac-20379]|uniref:sugar phosphate isomerase/epimerase family protein n=1 Tax=Burkholderia sp. Ac-20379 TaxID=2703900 RepID=UPI00197D123A|nr:sugar phosphate isomerase/epimerase family protein [Burkholderia sp. Ac-20379]MBN3723373.1 sugar phosphate isomerase/epimerase [Burkholderia sp. Ac-20379]